MSSASLARLEIWAAVVVGGIAVTLDLILIILGHFQALDYLQTHWEPAYRFAVSDKTHYVLLAVAIGMFGFVIWKLARKQESVENSALTRANSPSQQHQDVSSSVRDSGNAKIEQHFHGHPSPPIITVPPQQPEEIKPRIIFLAVKKINATLDTGIYETNEKGDADCIKACFRNEVEYEKPTKDATGVKAHVRLMDSDGAEIGEGFSGLQWLGDNVGDEIDIAKSESACVCIFIINRSDKRWFVPVWKKVYGGFVDDTQTLSHVPATAEIKLSNRKGLLLPPVLIDIKIDGDAISVTPRKTK